VRDIGRDLIGRSRESSRLRKGEFWALKDVSFELQRGSGVGLIGPNGSGKTTLLRIVSGLIKPDEGKVRVRGRVAPLFALGAAFNPVLSGRENVYINMAMLGLSRAEISARYDEVLDFAEIGDAIDAPLQTYSSGMTARLGFACAILTSPDVVLVDEVLAVGDMRFRAKSYRKLSELRKQGVAVVVVSHSINAILALSDHVIYLRQGHVAASGEPVQVVTRYENDMSDAHGRLPTGANAEAKPVAPALGATGLQLAEVFFADESGARLPELQSGRVARLVVRYTAARAIKNVYLSVLIRELTDQARLVLNLNSGRDGEVLEIRPGPGQIELTFPQTVLGPGLYVAKVMLTDPTFYVFDALEEHRFVVRAAGGMNECAFYQPRRWSVLPCSSGPLPASDAGQATLAEDGLGAGSATAHGDAV
jgi:lipopolysaccharide transport system ATP-binding protein